MADRSRNRSRDEWPPPDRRSARESRYRSPDPHHRTRESERGRTTTKYDYKEQHRYADGKITGYKIDNEYDHEQRDTRRDESKRDRYEPARGARDTYATVLMRDPGPQRHHHSTRGDGHRRDDYYAERAAPRRHYDEPRRQRDAPGHRRDAPDRQRDAPGHRRDAPHRQRDASHRRRDYHPDRPTRDKYRDRPPPPPAWSGGNNGDRDRERPATSWNQRDREADRRQQHWKTSRESDRRDPPRQQPSRHEGRDRDTPRSNDPDFALKVRVLNNIIKMAHHYHNVSAGKDIPATIKKTQQYLTNLIKPARPNTNTLEQIAENAKNWAHNTITLLREHYESAMRMELRVLNNFRIKEWKEPFEIAIKWAKKYFGRRMDQRTEEIAVDAITNGLESLQDKGPFEPGARSQISLNINDTLPYSSETLQAAARRAEEYEAIPDEEETLSSPEKKSPLEQRAKTRIFHPPSVLPFLSLQPTVRRKMTTRSASTPATSREQPEPEGDHLLEQSQDDLEVLLKLGAADTQREPTAETNSGSFTSFKVDKLHTAVQSRLTTSSNIVAQSKELRLPHRHPNSTNKTRDWVMRLESKWIIMGDSNVSRFPPHRIKDLQVDSFPGATFRNAEDILMNVGPTLEIEIVILSFGLNNRTQQNKTALKDLMRMFNMAKQSFPCSRILIPQINYDPALPHRERQCLDTLNEHIATLGDYLPKIPEIDFRTDPDQVHWTTEAASAIFNRWSTLLN